MMGKQGSTLAAILAVVFVTLLQSRHAVSVGILQSAGLPEDVLRDDFEQFKKSQDDGITMKTCDQICSGVGVDPAEGCRLSNARAKEEVIVMSNGDSGIVSYDWDTVSMVVSSLFYGSHLNGLEACTTHSKGKRYGLKETVKPHRDSAQFEKMLTLYQGMLMVDHFVFDLLEAFSELDDKNSSTIDLLGAKLRSAIKAVRAAGNDREVYCIVPWQPPCDEDSDCGAVKDLLLVCDVLLMSPDSFNPEPATNVTACTAGATVPVSKFLYGIARYVSLQRQPSSIVAGIPWHGYAYFCSNTIAESANKRDCRVNAHSATQCFGPTNRERRGLALIHRSNIAASKVGMDHLNQALYYNLNETSQLWFENYTTLYLKYSLVKDLGLRGLSVFYGDDMVYEARVDDYEFSIHAWDFLTHNVLHAAVYKPVKNEHYYADTVAGVGVGCLLLGTILGVVFTCIAFKRGGFNGRGINRPFKLDEDVDDYRDDL